MSTSYVYEYKGYLGSAEVDPENNVLVGRLLFIRDAIAYSAADVAGLKAAFEEAVDDYLRSCDELGDAPDVPCKGSFNVRVSPQLHRKAAMAARLRGQSLNDFVGAALTSAVGDAARPVEHIHTHHITVQVDGDAVEPVYLTTEGVSSTARARHATAH